MGKLKSSCRTLKMPALRENFQHQNKYVPIPLPSFAEEFAVIQSVLDGTDTYTQALGIDEDCLWSDGEAVYYSGGGLNYVFDKNTITWSKKDWINPPPSMFGIYNWSDGENIYSLYGSRNEDSFILNKETNTWEQKHWNGLDEATDFMGSYIWTDGENVYESNGAYHYVLNKQTETWEEKHWNGLDGFESFYPYSLWTDGEHIYYSYGSIQYVLDKQTDTWAPKTWKTLDNTQISFEGRHVWYDGKYYVYSTWDRQDKESISYALMEDGETWRPYSMDWQGFMSIESGEGEYYFLNGENFWSDGNNIYYADWLNYGVLLPQEAKIYSYANGVWGEIGCSTTETTKVYTGEVEVV